MTNQAIQVFGQTIDQETRCRHYHGEKDIVAIKFYCCHTYYPCYQCHEAEAGHPVAAWPKAQFSEQAILCGACQTELTIIDYLTGKHACPHCDAAFNPNCQLHENIYFSKK